MSLQAPNFKIKQSNSSWATAFSSEKWASTWTRTRQKTYTVIACLPLLVPQGKSSSYLLTDHYLQLHENLKAKWPVKTKPGNRSHRTSYRTNAALPAVPDAVTLLSVFNTILLHTQHLFCFNSFLASFPFSGKIKSFRNCYRTRSAASFPDCNHWSKYWDAIPDICIHFCEKC